MVAHCSYELYQFEQTFLNFIQYDWKIGLNYETYHNRDTDQLNFTVNCDIICVQTVTMKVRLFLVLNYGMFLLSTLPADVYSFRRYFKARSPDLFVYGLKLLNRPINRSFEFCMIMCSENCHGFAYNTRDDTCQLLQHNMYSTGDDDKLEEDYDLFVPETDADDNGICTREQATLDELKSYITETCK